MTLIYKKFYNLPINILRLFFLLVDIAIDMLLVVNTLIELFSILTIMFIFTRGIIYGYITYNGLFLSSVSLIVILSREFLLNIFPNYLSSLVAKINIFLYSKTLK